MILKGKTEGTEVFEPLLSAEVASQRLTDYLACDGLLERKPAGAAAAFAELAERFPDDRLINVHAQRLAGGETGSTIIMPGK